MPDAGVLASAVHNQTRAHSQTRTRARPTLFLHRDLSEQALTLPPEPSFNEAELAAARQEGFDTGYAAGLAAGLADAAAARETAEAQALDAIAASLSASRGEAAQVADAAAAAAAAALVAALDAVMPELIRRSALTEAGAMLTHLLPAMPQEPQVTIRVEPELAPGVTALIERLPPEQRPGILIDAAAGLQPGEVQLRWAAGRAARRPGDVWREVMQAFAPSLQDASDAAPLLTSTDETTHTQASEISHAE